MLLNAKAQGECNGPRLQIQQYITGFSGIKFVYLILEKYIFLIMSQCGLVFYCQNSAKYNKNFLFSVVLIVYEQVGFKMFLGVTATVTNWDAEGTTCSLVLEDNPLVDFVELPDTCQGLHYCNILSGVMKGALEMVSCCLMPHLL